MAVSIEDIKRLRELTGVGMTDAKKALEESAGDFDKALAAMRKKGLTKAEKRGQREARSGLIGSYNHDGRIGVLVEVNCETDFVARNEIFVNLVKDIAMQIAASNPEYLSPDDVSTAVHDAKVAELTEKAVAEGKPENLLQNIVGGMVHKYFGERCLLTQPFIKDPAITVNDYIKQHNARLGENIIVRRFSHLALGEVS
ncbi:MAG: translation elongation factor Ts [Candidatus Saccharimonadales bacterium]